MTRTIAITLAVLMLYASAVEGAINAATVWEVRATGNAANGGGYFNAVPGTSVDYSQQDAAQLSLTDLACDEGAATTLTSATGGFTAAMQGNTIRIASGTNFTAGWYQITGYTNTNTVTIDRDPTDGDGGNGSSGVGAVGGGIALGSAAIDAEFGSQVVAGNTVYCKGAWTVSETCNWGAADGTTTAPITYIGYNTARGTRATGTDRPAWNCGAYVHTPGDYTIFRDIAWTGTGTAVVGASAGGFNSYYGCKIINTTTSAGRVALQVQNLCCAVECEIACNLGTAVNCVSNAMRIDSCYIHDSATAFVMLSYSSILNSIIDTCTTGVTLGNYPVVAHNTFYNCTTGINGTASMAGISRNLFEDCTTPVSMGSDLHQCVVSNCWGSASPTLTNLNTYLYENLSADPLLTDPANGDFTLTAGSPCLDAGAQVGTDTGVVGDYKVNIGADQDDNVAAASSVVLAPDPQFIQ